ncbi:MAG: hypothetical protein WC683_02585 [bacterium]
MADYLVTHPLTLWAALTLILLGIVAGSALAVYRFRIIRDLRKRMHDAEAKAQEYLNRIVSLTTDAPDAKDKNGHPYREPAEKVGDDTEKKSESAPADPRTDDLGRLRWKGKEEFFCHVCNGVKCSEVRFYTEATCKWKHKGSHLHATCGQCDAIIVYGMASEKPKYRSEVEAEKPTGEQKEKKGIDWSVKPETPGEVAARMMQGYKDGET